MHICYSNFVSKIFRAINFRVKYTCVHLILDNRISVNNAHDIRDFSLPMLSEIFFCDLRF